MSRPRGKVVNNPAYRGRGGKKHDRHPADDLKSKAKENGEDLLLPFAPLKLRNVVDVRLNRYGEDEDHYAGVTPGTPKMEVQCPNFHRLIFIRGRRDWTCDASRKLNNRFVKSRFGIKDSEPWGCLSGRTGFGDVDGRDCYRCRTCDFDLCVQCYKRAKRAMDKMKAVAKVLSSADKVEWSQSKLMVVGEGRAGKTSTVRTLLGEAFVQHLPSTVGANLTHARSDVQTNWKAIPDSQKDDVAVEAAVRKLKEEGKSSGNRSRSRMNVMNGMNGNAIGNVITAAKSFRKSGKRRGVDRAKPIVAGSNGRSVGRRRREAHGVHEPEVAKAAGNMKLELLGKSLHEMRSIKYTIWDYGGQEVFYALHHLFLTQYGVYIIVFNLGNYVEDSRVSEGYLSYWLQSIRLHANEAPVLIVGTHADNVTDQRAAFVEADEGLRRTFSHFSQVEHNTEQKLIYFPLSNRTQEGIGVIRKALERCSRTQSFLYTKVSMQWLRCLDRLQAKREPYVDLGNVQVIAREEKIVLEDEVNYMLELFHKLGVLIHFTSTVTLERIVVLSPQWLIDQVGKVIRDPALHKYDMTEVASAGLEDDIEALKATCVATKDLLTHFWGAKTYSFLVDLLRRTMLLSEWPYASLDDKAYFVPSLLKDSTVQPIEGDRCKLTFLDGFLPDGVFQRLVCLGLEFTRSTKGHQADAAHAPQISRTCAVLRANETLALCLELNEDEILVTSSPAPKAKFLVSVVQSLMRKINDDVMHAGLNWSVQYFSKEANRFLTEENAKAQLLAPWFGSVDEAQLLDTVHETRLDIDNFLTALS